MLVKVTREGGRRRSPEGGVQCILERLTPSLLAQIEQQQEQLLATPLDDRLLTSVVLPAADAEHLDPEHNSVVEVLIDRYPVAQFCPQGHVARSLPVNGGEAADLELLLTKHRLNSRAAVPRSSLRTLAAGARDDLTAQPALLPELWSGEGAPALPALALEARDGGWTLWLHSPAVAERFAPGGTIDQWLREQADALCVGRRWLPLLSPALSKAAAFAAGQEQAAVSVALQLDAEGRLQGYRFCRSQIKPLASVGTAALTALVERKPKSRTIPAVLKPLKGQLEQLEQLVALGQLLRSRRLEAGSIELDLALPPIESLGDLSVPAPGPAQQGWLQALPPEHPAAILREAVLLAERALGEHLAALELPALFAVNPVADSGQLNDVAKAALALDIPLELGEEGHAGAAELATAFAASSRSRSLQQQLCAVLPPVQLGDERGDHAVAGQVGEVAALAPWTCPTLHYADIWNQQLLVLLLSEGKDRPSPRHKTSLDLASPACHGAIDWPLLEADRLGALRQVLEHGLGQRLNGRRRFQSELESDLLAMAQARQAEPLVGQVLPGVISGVQSYGFFVEVPPSNVEGLVHVSSLKDDWYEYRSRQNRLVGRKNRRTYKLGDSVEVEIEKVDALRHQIDLAVVQPDVESLDDQGGLDQDDATEKSADRSAKPSAELADHEPDSFAAVPVLSEV